MKRVALAILLLSACGRTDGSTSHAEAVPQRAASDEHRLARARDGHAVAGVSGALRFTIGTDQTDDGLSFGARGDLRVSLRCVGRVSSCSPRTLRRAVVDENRLLVTRDDVTEWFLNDARGLEQGFSLRERPAGTGPLRVELRSNVTVSADGAGLRIGDVLVRHARAWDANGTSVPAQLVALDDGFAIEVDDEAAVYPLTIDPTYLAAQKTLVPTTALAAEGTGGYAVAVDAKGLVSGVPKRDGTGAAYVWTRDASNVWAFKHTLKPSVTSAGQDFGKAIALDGDTLVVGAPGQDETGKLDVGAAFVFVRDATGIFVQQAKLLTSDGLAGDGVGAAVAISGNTIALGVSKRRQAYVFVRSGTTWTEQYKGVGVSTGNYGISVAVSGERLMVGDANNGTGKIFSYLRTGTAWADLSYITPDAALTMDFVGTSLAMDGDVMVAGSRWRTEQGRAECGTAWIFTRSATGTWRDVATLAPPELTSGANFGHSVAVRGGWIAVGSPTQGIWLYERDAAGTFVLKERLGPQGVGVGSSVAIAETVVVGGATLHDEIGKVDVGGAYVFEYQEQKANGVACTATKECASGVCVDGVCCDRACAGCEACTAVLKGSGADGLCGPIPADTDPRSACAQGAGYPASCLSDGMCDGTGKCRSFAKAGTACGTTTCTAGSVTGKTCNGSDAICADGSAPCAPYGCATTACKTSCVADSDCTPDSFCTTTGACVPKKTNGGDCSAARECASAFCVDGACCNSACAGNCQACDVAGAKGTCAPVAGSPHGTRPACPGGAGTCAGTCDGTNGGTCTFPAGKECSASCEADEQTLGRCDMAGACKLTAPTGCSGFTCDTDRCRTTCSDDTQCAAKHRCEAGACIPADGRCAADGLSVVDAEGKTASCGAIRCKDGRCLTTCESSDDCAPSYTCNVGRCEAGAATGEDSGCAFKAPRKSLTGAAFALLLLGVLSRRRARAH